MRVTDRGRRRPQVRSTGCVQVSKRNVSKLTPAHKEQKRPPDKQSPRARAGGWNKPEPTHADLEHLQNSTEALQTSAEVARIIHGTNSRFRRKTTEVPRRERRSFKHREVPQTLGAPPPKTPVGVSNHHQAPPNSMQGQATSVHRGTRLKRCKKSYATNRWSISNVCIRNGVITDYVTGGY